MQARACKEAGEATADDDDILVVVDRGAGIAGSDVGVVIVVMREATGQRDVLIGAVGTQALVALDAIFLAQSIGIEAEVDGFALAHSFPPPRAIASIIRARSRFDKRGRNGRFHYGMR
jgi:hypothetical protein